VRRSLRLRTREPERPKASVLGATPAGIALSTALAARFGQVSIWEPDPDIGRPLRGRPGIAAVSADLADSVRDSAFVGCAVLRRDLDATLEAVGPHLVHGAIVLIATIGHEAAHASAARLLPGHVSVACFTTFPPPECTGPRERRDRATNAAAGISPASGAHQDAVGVIQAIIEATGAVPFFGEAREIDGLAAASLALPSIVGAAVVRATIANQSARDLDRAGSECLAAVTSVLDLAPPTPEDLQAIAEHVARLLRDAASDLLDIASGLDDAVPDVAAVAPAADRRRAWLAARATPEDAVATIRDAPRPARRRFFF